jgi:hypothetical protein
MKNIRLKEEDSLASIDENGPSCITGVPKHFPLENLLGTIPNYVIKGLDTARICLEKTEPFESPVLFLYDRDKDQNAVCIRREDKLGHVMYGIYSYDFSMLVSEPRLENGKWRL